MDNRPLRPTNLFNFPEPTYSCIKRTHLVLVHRAIGKLIKMKTCLEFTLEKNIIEYIHFFLGVLHSWGKCKDSSLFHHCKFYYVWYLLLYGKPVLKTGVLQCDKFYCHYEQLFHVYGTIVLNSNECTHFEYVFILRSIVSKPKCGFCSNWYILVCLFEHIKDF